MSSAPATGTQYVKVAVSTTEAGLPVDPTDGTATMLFSSVGAASPAADDTGWKDADWETDTTRDPDRHYVRALVGPDGVIDVTARTTYWVWVKVEGIGSEVVILRAGEHTAT